MTDFNLPAAKALWRASGPGINPSSYLELFCLLTRMRFDSHESCTPWSTVVQQTPDDRTRFFQYNQLRDYAQAQFGVRYQDFVCVLNRAEIDRLIASVDVLYQNADTPLNAFNEVLEYGSQYHGYQLNKLEGWPAPDALCALVMDSLPSIKTDIVMDPFVGTGNLLLHAARRYRSQPIGRDVDASMVRFAHTRASLMGLDKTGITSGDSLSPRVSEMYAAYVGRVDLVVSCPPFLRPIDQYTARCADPDLGLTNDCHHATAAIRFALKYLRPGGHGAIVVPDTWLSSGVMAQIRVRKLLMDEHDVQLIRQIPREYFAWLYNKNKGIDASLLVFCKDASANGISFRSRYETDIYREPGQLPTSTVKDVVYPSFRAHANSVY